ncbi:MAG: hypothetical protein ACKOER_06215 [Betaproteobacteria bacterium]
MLCVDKTGTLTENRQCLDRAIAQAVEPHPLGWSLLDDWPVQAQQPMAHRQVFR